MKTHKITFTLNGREETRDVLPNLLLTDFLRDEMKLTGTKVGCGKGECGACTILLDGHPVNACLIFAVQIDGHSILTIEGLAKDREMTPIQKAFIEEGSIQCGFCTPGMIISAHALLQKNPKPSIAEIQDALCGNLCRCTGYVKIINAVKKASEMI